MNNTSKQTPQWPKPPTNHFNWINSTRIQLWEPHLASEPVDFSPIENQVFPHELIAARDENNKAVRRWCPWDSYVHHAYLNMQFLYRKENNIIRYLALIMASTHSAHCSSESHSNRYFLSASSRNASSRNKEYLIIKQLPNSWQTTLLWTDDYFCKSNKKGKTGCSSSPTEKLWLFSFSTLHCSNSKAPIGCQTHTHTQKKHHKIK